MLGLVHFLVNVCKSLLVYLVLAGTWSHLVLRFDHLDLESPVLFDGLVIIRKVRSRCCMWLNTEMTCGWSQRNCLVYSSQILVALNISTLTIHHGLKGLLHRYSFQLILFPECRKFSIIIGAWPNHFVGLNVLRTQYPLLSENKCHKVIFKILYL